VTLFPFRRRGADISPRVPHDAKSFAPSFFLLDTPFPPVVDSLPRLFGFLASRDLVQQPDITTSVTCSFLFAPLRLLLSFVGWVVTTGSYKWLSLPVFVTRFPYLDCSRELDCQHSLRHVESLLYSPFSAATIPVHCLARRPHALRTHRRAREIVRPANLLFFPPPRSPPFVAVLHASLIKWSFPI